jgi:putative transposase
MRQLLTGAAFGLGPGWITRALGLLRAEDDRFTDEEILMILRAGEAGLKLADVCAAGGIPPVTYYKWKIKFNGLTPSEVRNRRRLERRKRRAGMAAVAALIVLSVGAAGRVLGIPNASQSQAASPANAPENPVKSRPAAPAATATIPVPAPNLESAGAEGRALQAPAVRQSTEGDAPGQPAGQGTSAAWAHAEDIETADPNGYVVQVVAVPNLQEARAVREQLASAGYHAYLTAIIVDHVELYRVRVGPLESRPAAQEVARRLEREGHPASWVTTK